MKRDARLIAIVVLAFNTVIAVARDHALISALAGAATGFAIAVTVLLPEIGWPGLRSWSRRDE